MDPFRYAKNFYSTDALPQQVIWQVALLLLSLVAIMAGIVLIRRAMGKPHRSAKGALPPPNVAVVERYEIGARLWHVGVLGILLVLGFSGLAFFAPGTVFSPLPFGLTWLYVHLIFAAMFIFGAVFHAIKAGYVDLRSMMFNRGDWQELRASTKYYLGQPYELPKLGKYGIWNKLFHVALIITSLTMIVSGIYLSLDTLGWAQIDQNTHRQQRLLHDLGTYAFLALIAAHVFWLFLKKSGQVKAMVTGKIEADTFIENHDWNRWKPHVVSQIADKGKVDDGK